MKRMFIKKKPVKLTAAQQEEVRQKLQQLAQQDEIPLPDSLRSSNLLAKLQEQPSFVRLDSDPAPRRRSVYVITTCAAALMMVVGLSRIMPGLSKGTSGFAVNDSTSSMALASAQSNQGGISNYQEIITALQYLAGAENPSAGPMVSAAPYSDAAGGGGDDNMAGSDIPEDVEAAPEETEEAIPEAPPEMDGASPQAASGDEAPAEEPEEPEEPAGEPEEAIEAPAAVEAEDEMADDSDGVEYGAPFYYSFSAVSNTSNWTYWLDSQSNTLRQIALQDMEQTAQAALPQNAYVTKLESYGDLIACIDPYQLSYYDQGSLVSTDSPGVTVHLYQRGEGDSLTLVDAMSMSGVYETSYLSGDGKLFLVSNQQVYAGADTIQEALESLTHEELEPSSRLADLLPVVYHDIPDESPSLLPPEQISMIGTPVELNYLNVMIVDLTGEKDCAFWAFLGRRGSVSCSGSSISMMTADGEGGCQLVYIDFSGDRVSYRLSKSMEETEIVSAAPKLEEGYSSSQSINGGK